MRSLVKQFESICHTSPGLKWDGGCCSISAITVKYVLLLEAVRPFVEAAKYIPKGTPANEDIGCIPRSCFCIGDFYNLLDLVDLSRTEVED